MRKFTLFLMLTALLLVSIPAFSQVDELDAVSRDDSELIIESGEYRSFLEVDYGTATPDLNGLDETFQTLGMLELKFGISSVDILQFDLVSLEQDYVFASYFYDNLGFSGDTDSGEINSELARFGFGNRTGYGYGGSGLKLDLYNQNAFDWTKLTPVDYDSMDQAAQDVFDRYGGSYRFGGLTEAGLGVHLTPGLALTAGAEGAVIYPRTIFWPWLGSVAIYSTVQGALSYYSEQIVKASPSIGPVISFLLKTGVSWGYYYLLQDDMFWPFNYEAPVTVSSFKIGASITF